MDLVAGRKRVPRPATGKTALRIFFFELIPLSNSTKGNDDRAQPVADRGNIAMNIGKNA
jgi:hypothetical protein